MCPILVQSSYHHLSCSLHIKTPALEQLYLGRVLGAGLPTVITLLRGVHHLRMLSFFVYDVHDAQVIKWMPELDHLLLDCHVIVLEALQSLLRSLASHSAAYSLQTISIRVRGRGVFMRMLINVFKSWEKHQFPELLCVSVEDGDDEDDEDRSEDVIADLMQVGEDKGFEITLEPLEWE